MNSYFAPLKNDNYNNQKITCIGSLTIITLRKVLFRFLLHGWRHWCIEKLSYLLMVINSEVAKLGLEPHAVWVYSSVRAASLWNKNADLSRCSRVRGEGLRVCERWWKANNTTVEAQIQASLLPSEGNCVSQKQISKHYNLPRVNNMTEKNAN